MPHERLRRRRREELRSNSSAVLRSNTAFLDSSMVEHAAVNRGVVGSSPTRGGKGKPVSKYAYGFFVLRERRKKKRYIDVKQVVRCMAEIETM